MEEQLPKITLGGSTQLVRDEHEVVHGEKIFRDLLIIYQPFSAEPKDSSEELVCILWFYKHMLLRVEWLNILEMERRDILSKMLLSDLMKENVSLSETSKF